VKAYTVGQLAKMAGVSVRTLHHYDQIGLLTPSARTAVGYRLYEEQDLLRLQQILFFKELDFPLSAIRASLDDPAFDQVEALKSHRRLLQERAERLTRLLITVDKTIQRLTKEDTAMELTDEELYEGFTKEQIERYTREARERFGSEQVQASEQRLRKLPKAQWAALKAETDAVTRLIATVADQAPDASEVQALMARHHALIEQFYPAPAEVYRGLGQLYATHEEFRAFYEKYRPGLADFMAAAMTYYADHTLNSK
jgi:DNA-binding transcriptional MerR regulator